MRYFILKQSVSLNNAVKIPQITNEELNSKSGIVKKAECGFKIFLNFYEKNVIIVSSKLKLILEKNNKSISDTPLVITNQTTESSKLYWIIDMNKIDNTSKEIKKIKIGVREFIAVDLKTAEEILRNSILDIYFKEVEI